MKKELKGLTNKELTLCVDILLDRISKLEEQNIYIKKGIDRGFDNISKNLLTSMQRLNKIENKRG
jgi:hypothetical protein